MSKLKKKTIKQWNKEIRDYQLQHQGFTGTIYKKKGSRWVQVIYKDLKIIN